MQLKGDEIESKGGPGEVLNTVGGWGLGWPYGAAAQVTVKVADPWRPLASVAVIV